jgi:hypothetical protein
VWDLPSSTTSSVWYTQSAHLQHMCREVRAYAATLCKSSAELLCAGFKHSLRPADLNPVCHPAKLVLTHELSLDQLSGASALHHCFAAAAAHLTCAPLLAQLRQTTGYRKPTDAKRTGAGRAVNGIHAMSGSKQDAGLDHKMPLTDCQTPTMA